jgi:hypothetical protein
MPVALRARGLAIYGQIVLSCLGRVGLHSNLRDPSSPLQPFLLHSAPVTLASDRLLDGELRHDEETICMTPRSRAQKAVEAPRVVANRSESIRWLLTGIGVS